MGKTIVIRDNRYIDHKTTPGHPECPERLEAIYAMLDGADMQGTVESVEPRPATKEELAYNHAEYYVEEIAKTAGNGVTYLDPDTSTSDGSWEAASLAAGGLLLGLDMTLDGRADNGFALVRPPGHHAESARAMGFCLFNNVAVGAYHLLKKHNMKRILIIDWDIHHGNGTQDSFYGMPEVLYFSSHQYPYYPGSGAFEETGRGDGTGYTVNVPLSGGQSDRDYLQLYQAVLEPIVAQYKPEYILVSAGYDIYHRDPLGTMDVTPEGFAMLTRFLKNLAATHCNGNIFLGLEGGYNIAGIAESVKHTLLALAEENSTVEPLDMSAVDPRLKGVIEKVKSVHGGQWTLG